MLTVACVLKSGGIYDATWVARLRDGVARHLPIEHRFVCLSDVDVPCERIPLVHGWPGWWSKIELFKLPGPVLFFDLDTAIVGDLSEIAQTAQRSSFAMLRDFYRLGDGVGSGVMAWDDDDLVSKLYRDFAREPSVLQGRYAAGGDQAFIEVHFDERLVTRWQDVLPGQIVSYKVHCRGGVSPVSGQRTGLGIPDGARVVCLHGTPKFADMPANDPVRLAWEMAT